MRHTNDPSPQDMKRLMAFALVFFGSILFVGSAAAIEPINATRFGGLAIEGYDPVAYFEDGEPVKGDKQFTVEWMGAKWRFASAEHRDLFEADPKRYAPQYGGYCAYAVSKGSTASIDPKAWSIVEDKLYLNYNQKIQKRWNEDVSGYIARADANWPGLLEK